MNLAAGAEERGSARLNDPADRSTTALRPAGLPDPVVDPERVLEGAGPAIRVGIVSQGRSTGRHRLPQHFADHPGQALGLECRRAVRFREAAGRRLRVEPGPVQGLADVDVAQARDEALVEEGRLQG